MTTEDTIDCDLLVIGSGMARALDAAGRSVPGPLAAGGDADGAFGMIAARTAGWH